MRFPFGKLSFATLFAVGALLPLSAQTTFTSIQFPTPDYLALTTVQPVTAADNVFQPTASAGGQTVTFTPALRAQTVPAGGWLTWNSPPFVESATPRVLRTLGSSTATLDLANPVTLFGFELEPDQFGVHTFTATFYSGPSVIGVITRDIEGRAGALVAAGSDCGFPITRVVITAADATDFAVAQIRSGSPSPVCMQVMYASNLNVGDSVINLTNSGALTLPTGLTTTGNICANVYTFDANEEMISCCSCLITPNGLNSLSAKTDLVSNTLTPGVPTSIVIKLLATTPLGLSAAGTGGTCNAASPTIAAAAPGVAGTLVPGLFAWGTTLHALPTTPVTFGLTENRFEPSPLSIAELTKLSLFCGFIQANGSGFGICKSCRTGGLGAGAR